SRAGGHLDASVASIEPYLPYVGDSLAARLASGTVAAIGDLELGWRDAFTLAVAKGQASVEDWSITLPNEQKPAVAVGRLSVDGVSASLAERTIQAAGARLEGADMELVRDAAGNLNLQRLVQPAADDAPAAAGSAAAAPADDSAAAGSAAAGSDPPWKVRVDQLDLAGNQVAWRDLG